jgi:hypothetical protein
MRARERHIWDLYRKEARIVARAKAPTVGSKTEIRADGLDRLLRHLNFGD